MKDLEKRLSIIEEKLGIVNLENQIEKKEGKWYKASYKSKYLVYAEKLSGNDVLKGYGFCDSGNWHVFTYSYASILNTVEATTQEVEEDLIKEAKSRGYKKGANCFFGTANDKRTISTDEIRWVYWSGTMALTMGINIIFRQDTGQWSIIIEEDKLSEPQQPTLEQDIQQLKDKYKQYKFTITIEDNI